MINRLAPQTLALKFPSRANIVRTTIVFVAIGVCLSLGLAWTTFPITAYIALALYSSYFLWLLKTSPGTTMWLLAVFGMIAFTQFISGILIESGGYLSETQEMGSVTGGFLRLAILYIILFCIVLIIVETYVQKWEKDRRITLFVLEKVHPYPFMVMLFNFCLVGGLVYLFLIGLKNGFPLITGEDRFDFSRRLGDPIYTSIMGNRTGAAAFLALMVANAKNKAPYFGLALAMAGVSALLGDKFTGYVSLFGLLSAPTFCKIAWKNGALPLRNVFILGIIITLVTMPLVYIVYGGLDNSSKGLDKMKDRMTLQGQLWFLSDREVKDIFRFNADTLSVDWDMMTAYTPVPKIARDKPNPFQGTAYMMVHFAPPRVAYTAFNNGVNFCLGLHGYALEMLGWFGLFVFNILLAVSLGLILSGLLYSIVYARCIYLFFFAKFYTFWEAMASDADVFMFINWKSTLFLVALGIYYIIDVRYLRRLEVNRKEA